MNSEQLTYTKLFGLLKSLGFRGESPVENRYVFEHKQSDTHLVYSVADLADPVRGADLLSTEVHLTGRGLIDEPLDTVVNRNPVEN